MVGAILTPGQRTVAATLRVMGRSNQRDYARYHEVLNRAVWSSRELARVLLMLMLRHLDRGDGPLVFGIDETLERRRGPRIKARGIYRDAVRSSRSQVVKASGLRWVSMMWLGHIPWAGRFWALPFLTVLAPSERFHQQQGRRHKKVTDWARQMTMHTHCVRCRKAISRRLRKSSETHSPRSSRPQHSAASSRTASPVISSPGDTKPRPNSPRSTMLPRRA